ncbi:3-deoxy-D-manno-octulosonic acid transferase [Candidatus Finniella inopinata]|uniref:3-deoxy-D-manno-octulosonic acid transferase n=1 Tax=Candidatus Finniella inopinata TaxID=1696036 RepID=A0A4Q7DPH1_9PROT|nr:3-deoxy-D-manno-octulosonic acid transferase [Candidatus Finniella inopinata]RZI46896.1 3-deoxy-D-manno-octulosonic acid transferase [Candidatus Finniella inopinata]
MFFFFFLYRFLSLATSPFICLWLRYRLRLGLEEKSRLTERYGISSLPRLTGRLIWIHAASVGETVSLVPLLKLYKENYPDHTLLLTTTTVTACRIAKERLNGVCVHQYIPFDVSMWAHRFLKFWQPSLAIFTESELWPNLIWHTKRQGIPLILLNARLSDRSYRRWRRFRFLSKALLGKFEICLAPSETIAHRLGQLGAPRIQLSPHLKFAAEPLPVNLEKLERFQSLTVGRSVWVAASTHPGEEKILLNAHQVLRRKFEDLLLILVPRHPDRAQEVRQVCDDVGETACLYSGQEPDGKTSILIGDTIGDLGLFFRLSKIVFIGGSLVPTGGHNPIEPALLKCAVLYGPHHYNFREVCEVLRDVTFPIDNDQELVTMVSHLLEDKHAAPEIGQRAFDRVQSQAQSLQGLVKLLGTYAKS